MPQNGTTPPQHPYGFEKRNIFYIEKIGERIISDIYSLNNTSLLSIKEHYHSACKSIGINSSFKKLTEELSGMELQYIHIEFAAEYSDGHIKNERYYFIGCLALLLSRSNYHMNFESRSYFFNEILPALDRNQVVICVDSQFYPAGAATWAWLNKSSLDSISKSGRCLYGEEWREGDNLFFNDWIFFLKSNSMMKYIKSEVFKFHEVTSLRRNMDGSVRRVNRWTGDSFRRINRGKLS